MDGIDSSFVVLFKDNTKKEVFLVLRSDYPIWVTTGGGIDNNETPKNTAIREAFEETGFKVKIVRKVGIYIYKKGGRTKSSHLFEGRVISGIFTPEYPGCEGKWFPVNKLPTNVMEWTKKRIKDAWSSNKEFVRKMKPYNSVKYLHLLFVHPIPILKLFLNRAIKTIKIRIGKT